MFSRPNYAKALVSADGKTKLINKKASHKQVRSALDVATEYENISSVSSSVPQPQTTEFNRKAAADDSYYINYLKYEMQNFMEIGLTDSEDEEDIDAEIEYLMQGGPIDIAQYHEYLDECERMNGALLTEDVDVASINKGDLRSNIPLDATSTAINDDSNSADSSINNQFEDNSNGYNADAAAALSATPLTAELMADIKREIERVMNGDFDMEAGSEYGAEVASVEKNPKRELAMTKPEAIERFYIKSELNPFALPFELPTSHDLKVLAEAEAKAAPKKNKKKENTEERAFCFDTFTNDPATLVKNHGNPYSREYVNKN